MEFLVLNTKFEAVAILDVFESFIWTDRYSKCGDFEIYTSSDRQIIETLKEDFYIWTEDSEHVMIIENRKIITDVEEGNKFLVSGRSLESILDRRIVWNQILLDGDFQTQIKRLLTENVINPSDSNRKISNFIFEETDDPYILSLKVQVQYTGDDLYEAVCKLCESVSIGFKITLNDNNQFVFKLYSGTDRSYDQEMNPYVVFSPSFENIVNSNYYESKAECKNVGLVAGEGEGSARRTVVVGESTSKGLSRRELYVDARDISSTTSNDGSISTSAYDDLLRQRGNEQLKENKIIQAFDGQVESTQMYRYGEHYFMGDITQLENEYGMESKVRVTEFIRSVDKDGIDSYPTFEVIEEREVS
nr:MAG TPA: hypothetical protein [Caudoviricetes sp.]